jgi:predicted amidohydrolase
MRIAALQMQAVAGDQAANVARIERAARDAAAAGAELLVVPELALPGYGAGAKMAELAEPEDGALVASLSDLARATGVAIVAGFAERDGDDVFNSAVFTDGVRPPVTYRKSHLYGPYEKGLFRTQPPETHLFDIGGIRLGMLICYDVEFPENVRRLALAGAQAVIVPTALPAGDSGNFIAGHMIAVRAFENQVFVAYINHCGSDALFAYAGLSRIAAPDGTILAEAGASGEALLIADLDPAAYVASAEANTYLRDLG